MAGLLFMFSQRVRPSFPARVERRCASVVSLSEGKSLVVKRPIHKRDASRPELVGSESRGPAEDDHMVQALSAKRLHHPLGHRIRLQPTAEGVRAGFSISTANTIASHSDASE
jgi:hypothetical protein